MVNRTLRSLIILGVLAVPLLQGQAGAPFVLQVLERDTVTTVASGASVRVGAAQLGQSVVITVRAVYNGASSVTITSNPTLLGSGDFQLRTLQPTPVTLSGAQSYDFEVVYRARTRQQVSALVTFQFSEAPPPGSPPTAVPTNGFVSISFIGTTPDFAVSYILQADGNFVPLLPGGTAVFPPTQANTTTTLQVSILNRGSGPGTVRSISVTGNGFQPIGIPLLPLDLPAATELRFGIRFEPKQAGSFTGSVQLAMGEAIEFGFGLEATATAPNLLYEFVTEDSITPITPGGLFQFADTAIGESVRVSFQIRNTGTGDATFNAGSIGVTGAGFQISDLPPFPQIIPPDSSLLFTVTFTPTQPGLVRGRLRVGSANFDIHALAVGNRLRFSYGVGDTEIVVAGGGTVLFPPAQIGAVSELPFRITNTGSSRATITRITLLEPRNGFNIVQPPPFPVTLDPQGSMVLRISFEPASTNAVNATLLVDTQSLTLSGSGAAPPPLPAYSINGPSGQVAPLSQPSISLSFAAPYPIPVVGTITLELIPGGFAGDPSVQFSTGGRTVAFTIPANTTRAQFPNGASEIRIQTGTVTAEIVLTASFATQSGFNLTPLSPQSLRMSVPATSPQLVGVQVAQRTGGALVLQVRGISTTRSLNRLNFQFRARSGTSLAGGEVVFDTTAPSAAWFNSPPSLQFGGQFTATVTFNVQSSEATDTSPLNFLDSVDVSAANEVGTSNTVSLRLN
jgi:hypothetical protein